MSVRCFPFFRGGDDKKDLLFCFHHAGGSASNYKDWAELNTLVNVVPYELPGNGARIGEKFVFRLEEVAKEAAREIYYLASGRNVYLYGHSMGAALAYLVCSELEKSYNLFPKLLVVAARHAPQDTIVESYKTNMGIEKLEEELRRLGGTPEEVFEDEEIKNYMLKKVFKSYRLNESFKFDGYRVKAPVIGYFGTGDSDATFEMMERWKDVTEDEFSLNEIEGGHFFPIDLNEEFLDRIIETIKIRTVKTA